jgi:hypothetical protein
MAVSHAAGRGGLAGVGARIVPWRQLAIGTIVNVSDRLTAFNCCLAHGSMHRKNCPGGVPPLSRAILSHIASDWPAFADVRAAARALSQKSRLANALSIAVNEVGVALAAALLCTDPPDASAEPEPCEDVESRAEAVRRALRLYSYARAIISDCTEPLAAEWKLSEPQIGKVLQAFESVVGGDWRTRPAYPTGSRPYGST